MVTTWSLRLGSGDNPPRASGVQPGLPECWSLTSQPAEARGQRPAAWGSARLRHGLGAAARLPAGWGGGGCASSIQGGASRPNSEHMCMAPGRGQQLSRALVSGAPQTEASAQGRGEARQAGLRAGEQAGLSRGRRGQIYAQCPTYCQLQLQLLEGGERETRVSLGDAAGRRAHTPRGAHLSRGAGCISRSLGPERGSGRKGVTPRARGEERRVSRRPSCRLAPPRSTREAPSRPLWVSEHRRAQGDVCPQRPCPCTTLPAPVRSGTPPPPRQSRRSERPPGLPERFGSEEPALVWARAGRSSVWGVAAAARASQ